MSKSFFFIISTLLATEQFAGDAMAASKITNVTAKRTNSGVVVDVSFDKPVSAQYLKPTFERNFVQFVLKSTKMDAARIVPVADSDIQKVFAYPYSSDIARIRLILKSGNQWAKGHISLWNNAPKIIRVVVKEVPRAVAPAPSVSAVAKGLVAEAPTEQRPNLAQNESKLLNEVLTNTREIDIHNPESVKAALNAAAPVVVNEDANEQKQIGVKNDPSKHFARMAIALFGILSVFLGGAWLFRRYAINLKKLPFGKKERLIQVVATHYLGNKKSISLVKVTGEYMVVGVSNEGIHLISKLGPEINVEKYLEDRFWGGTFEKHLGTYAKDQKVNKAIDLADRFDVAQDVAVIAAQPRPRPLQTEQINDAVDRSAPAVTVASQIADKVELSPVRASIREKLTKLKPLQ